MILFDYGHTLLYEPGYDTLRGEQALFQYVIKNPHNYSAKEINDFSLKLFFGEMRAVRQAGFELHERQFQQLLYESLGIALSVSLPEAERIFWYNTSPGAVMPGAGEMLDYINAAGIRSGVISNLGFSGAALENRLNRLLPNNRFEFVIASSEYGVRKPSPALFALALEKAGLRGGEVWFCGDNVRADVEGSAKAGMFPVWYEDRTVENPFAAENAGMEPGCAHLHIHAWEELPRVLSGLRR